MGERKILVMAGASGLIGTYLSEYLRNYEILKIGRQDFMIEDREFIRMYGHADTIINLSGAPVIRRWSKKNRREIMCSRVDTTRKLGCILQHDPGKERLYISASAIGIYNDHDEHTEDSNGMGSGFMAEVVRAWERAVFALATDTTKLCILRTGVVLSSKGGILARLIPLFRLGLGARIGKGVQYFSWIHIEDFARAVEYILENQKEGIYNLTAPGYCTNRELTKKLASSVKKPAYFVMPKFIIKLMFGGGAALVTGGQAAIPERLVTEGFQFKYPDLNVALKDIVN